MLTALLSGGKLSISMHAADCVGIVGLPEEIGRNRITFVQFNKVRDKVMSLLSGGLVPYISIVQDGLCDGNSVQHCNVCMEQGWSRCPEDHPSKSTQFFSEQFYVINSMSIQNPD